MASRNELKMIVDRLEGWREQTVFSVVRAAKTEDGCWNLIVKVENEEEPQTVVTQEADNAD